MEDWKEVTIGEITNVQTGPFGSQLHEKDYVKEGTPIVTVEHLGNRKFKTQNLPLVSDSDKKRLSKYILTKGDLVFSRVGSVDRCTYTAEENDGWMFSGRCLRVRPYENIDALFLYYYFNLDSTKQFIRNIAVGATMPSINTALMCEVPVKLPPLPTQQKIAQILSSLDDKIELNNKINTNLEQQAQALFKSWFVDGQEKNGTIGDYCNVKSGFAFKSSWWQDSGLKVVRIGDIEQGKLSLDSCAHVPNDKSEIAKDFILKGGDLVIAMTGATIGKFSMVPKTDEVIFANQRVGKFFLGENPIERVPFLYCTLCNEEVITEFINRGQGSAQPNISTGDILSIPCWIPESSEIERFNKTAQPLFETIISNQSENKKLSNLRDTLLPKLMNGEIEV